LEQAGICRAAIGQQPISTKAAIKVLTTMDLSFVWLFLRVTIRVLSRTARKEEKDQDDEMAS
jgi:hypothetical protein